MLKRCANLTGMYFRKARTRSSGCSYPNTLNMKPSFVMKVSPSVGLQSTGIVSTHLDVSARCVSSLKMLESYRTGIIFKMLVRNRAV